MQDNRKQDNEKQKIETITLGVFNNDRETYENNAKINNQIIFKTNDDIYIAEQNTKIEGKELMTFISSLINKDSKININIVPKIPDEIKDGTIYMVVDDEVQKNQLTNMLLCLHNLLCQIVVAGDVSLTFNAKDKNTPHLAEIFTYVYNTRDEQRRNKRKFFAADNYESIKYNMEFSDENSEKDNCKKIKNILNDSAPHANERYLANTNMLGDRYNALDNNSVYTLRLHSAFKNEQDNENKYFKQIQEISEYYGVYCQINDQILPDAKRSFEKEQTKANMNNFLNLSTRGQNELFPSVLNNIPYIGPRINTIFNKKKIDKAIKKIEKEKKKKNEEQDKIYINEHNKIISKEAKKNKLIDAIDAMKEQDIINADRELEKFDDEDQASAFNKNENSDFEFDPSGNKNNIIELENENDYFENEDGFDNDSEKNNPKSADTEKKSEVVEEEKEENLTHDNDERNKKSTPISKPMPPPYRKAPNRYERTIDNQQSLQQSRLKHDTDKTKKTKKQKPAKKAPETQNTQEQNIETLSFTEKTSKQDKKTPEPKKNYLILILLFILGIFPSLIYYFYKKNEQETWRKNNNNAAINLNNRPQSQQII